jgi:HSP20 family protein
MAEKQSMPIAKENAPPAEVMRAPLMSLRSDIDRLFEDVLSWSPFRRGMLEEPFTRLGLMRGAIQPRADLIEKEDGYEIDMDIPGFKKDDIEIALVGNNLTVRGTMEEEKKEEGREYYFCERQRGTFARSFSLPEGIDPDKIEADLNAGVLTINLPKTPDAQKKPRRVEVRSH